MKKKSFRPDEKPIDYLGKTREIAINNLPSDLNIINLIRQNENYDFEIARFEEIFDLHPLDIGNIHGSAFDRAMGFPERTGLTDIEIPVTKIASRVVAPKEKELGKLLEIEKEDTSSEEWKDCSKLEHIVRILSYLFVRIIHKRVPKYNERKPNLDVLSEAILCINSLMELMKKSKWIDILWDNLLWSEDLPIFDRISSLPDGADIHQYEHYFNKIRSKVNILENETVRDICSVNTEGNSRLKLNKRKIKIEGVTDFQISSIFSEQFVPVFPNLGLRYRIIINPKRKIIWSQGVCEKVRLDKLPELQRIQYNNVTIHLEPIHSSGPHEEQFPEVIHDDFENFNCENEIISMNLDRFDEDTNSWDLFSNLTKKKSSRRIILDSSEFGSDSVFPQKRKMEVLSILWAHIGGREDNNNFLGEMGLTKSSYNHALRFLIEKKLLVIGYHPNSGYVGLPDCLLLVLSDEKQSRTNKLKKWLIEHAPYMRLLYGGKKGGLFAIVRLPLFAEDAWIGYVLQQMKNGVLKDLKVILQPIKRITPYRLTALSRLYSDSKTWIDPWSTS